MESKSVGFCAVVVILGIIATAAGFAAEATKVKASEVDLYTDGSCSHPSSPALAFGIISAVFAIITQVYITITFGGCSCCRNDPNSTPISKLLSVLSWVATVIAVIILFAAAGVDTSSCRIVKPGIFATGAILALLSAGFAIAAYITVTPTPQTSTNPAVAMPIGGNFDPEKNNPAQYPPQQFPAQQYPQNNV